MKKNKQKLYSCQIFLSLFLITIFGLIISSQKKVTAAYSYPYYIKVNKQANCVTIYKKDENGKYTIPVKAMVCSTGNATSTGTFKTPAKYRWKVLLDNVWGQYSTRIYGSVLFHSVWYYEMDPSTQSGTEYNKLGTTCSHGCIRLTTADAKWIYDNCPIGTTVTIYNSSNPGPLGKPAAIKVPATRGWDPTDVTNPSNPYNSKKPIILGAQSQVVENGASVDIKKGVTAKNTTGFDATSRIKTTIELNGKAVSTVNTKIPGKYKVTYTITDEINRTAQKSVIFLVKGDTTKPVLTGVRDQIVNGKEKINRTFALRDVKATFKGKAMGQEKIKTTITKKSEKTYVINYLVTAENQMSAKARAIVRIDNKPPVIKGITNRQVRQKTVVNEKYAKKGLTITDNYSKLTLNDIAVTINKKDSVYYVTYTAQDMAGNITEKTAVFTITNYFQIKGVKDRVVPYDTKIDKKYALEGVSAFAGGKDVTNKLKVEIEQLKDKNYSIVYSISDTQGNGIEKTAVFTVEEQVLPEETPVPEQTDLPETTPTPEESETPETTPIPEESETPETTPVPEENETPETTPVPQESEIPEVTSVSE